LFGVKFPSTALAPDERNKKAAEEASVMALAVFIGFNKGSGS
jgi:hypothetical protein